MLRKSSSFLGPLLAFGALLCLWNLDFSMHLGDEAIHWKVIQNMRQSANYFYPTFDGLLYLNKPPLKMWLTFLPINLFGDINFSYRLVDALSGILTLFLTASIAKYLFHSNGVAALSVLFLCISPIFLFDHGVRYGCQDAFLLFLVTFALRTAKNWLIGGEDNQKKLNWKVASLFGILCGAAVMTKWIAGLLPWVVVFITLLLSRNFFAQIKLNWKCLLLALVLTLLPAFCYLAPHILANWNEVLASYRFNIEERLLTSGIHNRDDPLFYFKLLFLHYSAAPALILLAAVTFVCFKLPNKKNKELIFLFSWGVFPVILYSCLHSRLQWYILPSLPALSILSAWLVFQIFHYLHVSEEKPRKQKVVLAYLVIAFLCATVVFQATRSIINVFPQRGLLTVDSTARILVEQLQHSSQKSLVFYNFDPEKIDQEIISRREKFYLGKLRPFASFENGGATTFQRPELKAVIANRDELDHVTFNNVACRQPLKIAGRKKKSRLVLEIIYLGEGMKPVCAQLQTLKSNDKQPVDL